MGRLVAGGLVVLAAGGLWAASTTPPSHGTAPSALTRVRRGRYVRTVRLSGTVEAVRSISVTAPRLAGQPPAAPLVVTRLVPGGTRVSAGDLLVEFDAQEQLRIARDRRSDFLGLEEQIRQKRAEHAAARAADETALVAAENDVARARLAVQTNSLLPQIDADKNTLELEEAEARLEQLHDALGLKREAADADLRILEIQRDRAENDARHAEANASLMQVAAPFEGLVVLKSVFRGGQMAEVQEGEEVRSGMPVLDIVDPSRMQVRAGVNQADLDLLAPGQPVRVQLDAYPGLAFDGRVERIAPIAVPSGLTPTVRTFTARVSIVGSHQNLMPDLSAAVDVEVERIEDALIVPRDALVLSDEGAWVVAPVDGRFERRDVTVAAASAVEAAIASGVAEGDTVMRGAEP